MDLANVVTGIVALVGAGISIATFIRQRKKDSSEVQRIDAEARKVAAEAQNIIGEAAERLLKRYEGEIAEMRAQQKLNVEEIARLRGCPMEVERLKVGVLILIGQLEDMGVIPRWRP